jgi:hypothetical protein
VVSCRMVALHSEDRGQRWPGKSSFSKPETLRRKPIPSISEDRKLSAILAAETERLSLSSERMRTGLSFRAAI